MTVTIDLHDAAQARVRLAPAAARPPHVVIIVENLPVPLDRRVWQEACALRDLGYRVSVICPRMRGWTTPYEEREGIEIHRHAITGEAGGVAGFVAEYASALVGEFLALLRIASRGPIDVVHLCNPPDALFLAVLPLQPLLRARWVYDVHDLWPEMFEAKFGRRGLLWRMIRALEWCSLRLADVVIATNDSVRATVLTRGRLDPGRVVVVRTAPANLDLAAPEDDALRGGRRHLVGFIGVMGDADGVEYLLRAAHAIRTRHGREDIAFLLMGTGPDHARLVQLRDTLGLADMVAMPGRVSDAFLCSALRTMDLGVACDPINAYNDHCTMNKTLEYMAFGKPQVMFGTREGRVSAGDAAVYVDRNDADALADAIVATLDDALLRARLADRALARMAGELSWTHSVGRLATAYARTGCVPAPRTTGM